MEFANMLPHSPLRSPAWRFLRASNLIERGDRVHPEHDDSWIERFTSFLTTAENSTDTTGKPGRHPQYDHDLAAAFAIHCGPAAARGLLEAYLLTDVPLDFVAARCDLSLTVVEAYEALFFCVKDSLQARDWIWTQAIGRTTPAGYRADYPAKIWRAFGFAGGPLILETVIAVTTGQPLSAPPSLSPDEATAWAAMTEFQTRLSVAMMLAETSDEVAALIHLATKGPYGPSAESRKAIEYLLTMTEQAQAALRRAWRRARPRLPAEVRELDSKWLPARNLRRAQSTDPRPDTKPQSAPADH